MIRLLITLAAVLSPQEPDLAAALDRLKEDVPAARREAIRILEAAGARGVAAAIQALRAPAPVPPDVINALVRQLGAATWTERRDAMEQIVRLGPAVVERLEAHLNDPDPEVAWRVRFARAEIRLRAAREEPARMRQRERICEFLGSARDPAAVDPLLDVLTRKESPRSASGPGERDASAGPTEAVLWKAVEALSRFRDHLTREQAELVAGEALRLLPAARDRRVSASLVRALGRLRVPNAVAPLRVLVEDVSGRDVLLRGLAMSALVRIDDPEGVRAVIAMLRSEDSFVRDAAVTALRSAEGADFGIDGAAGPPTPDLFARVRAWWEQRYGRSWDTPGR